MMQQQLQDVDSFPVIPSKRSKMIRKGLLWLQFGMVVVNGAFAMWIFYKFGDALKLTYFSSLIYTILGALFIVFISRINNKYGVFLIFENGIGYQTSSGELIGPIYWHEISSLKIQRGFVNVGLRIVLHDSSETDKRMKGALRRFRIGKAVSLPVPESDAENVLSRCQQRLSNLF